MWAALAVLALQSRAAIAALPPVMWDARVELGDPYRLHADGLLGTGMLGWQLALERAFPLLPGLTAGPLVGVQQSFITRGAPGEPVFWASAGLAATLGLVARWSAPPWTVSLAPTLAFGTHPDAFSGSPIPNVDFAYQLWLGPAPLEVGYQVTPNLGVALRASMLPLAVDWRF